MSWRRARPALGPAAAAALGVVAIILGGRAGRAQAPQPVFWREEFSALAQIDLARTTAQVDTRPPGIARLPPADAALAWHVREPRLLAATAAGLTAFRLDAAAGAMRPDARVAGPERGLRGVAWLEDPAPAFAVATTDRVVVYALDADGAARRLAQISGLGGVRRVAGAGGRDLCVVFENRVGCYGWSGREYLPLPALAIEGVVDARAASYDRTRGRLAVATAAGVRVFGRSPAGWIERAGEGAEPGSPVLDVAWWGDGAGYWALVTGQVLAYALTPEGAVGWPAPLEVPAHAAAIAAVGAARGISVMALPEVRTWAWDPSAGQMVSWPERHAEGIAGARWRARAELQTRPWLSPHPVRQLRVTARALLPPGTAVSYEVSTDGCDTWRPAPADEIVDVEPGDRVCGRVALSTADPERTPEVDWFDIAEVRTVTTSRTARRAVLVR